jgi:predicted nucleic acid-binding protein
MDRILLDTSALSDVMRPTSQRLPAVARHAVQYLRSQGKLSFSEITCYEVLRGLYRKQAVKQLANFEVLCERSEILGVDRDVLDRAARLWAEGQSRGIVVDDSDLIIAATSLTLGVPLVTANPMHFQWIAGLTLVNWREP